MINKTVALIFKTASVIYIDLYKGRWCHIVGNLSPNIEPYTAKQFYIP